MTTIHVDQMTVRRNGERITVSIPITLKVRGGRKEIILPEGLAPDDSPASKSGIQESMVIGIARAHRWKALLESGQYASITELAVAIKMEKSYLGRLLNLTLLAPDIIIAILAGNEPSGLSLEKLTKNLPLEWVEQRKVLGFMLP
ncbi:MAG: hypothetical protein WCJ56_06455 [bacterium]